ncbi:urease accessory protein UreF [Tabrizicola sp. J26]|uniref:urease accessory protein UreF n=1 Tax=Alitabrizicola rongguiensis TaxID=2909234 RepID=UPI001F1F8244|nr:urease accessory UreF family protein [Tabrizicola rongguiensis]MCF1708459.1 urease accessory protein UreF [Tabrizicola rongguiensis]
MSEAGLLTLVQWLSPAFPVGGYAYSHGLEAAIASGQVRNAAALEGWIATILAEGAGRNDAILLAEALKPRADLPALASLAEAMAASRERLVETMEQGRALLATTNALKGDDHPPMPYPVALGAAAAPLGLPAGQVLGLYLHAFGSNLVQVGVRFIPLGQTDGQKVLAALHPVIQRVAREAAKAGLEGLGGGALRGDLAAMQHETMDVRIFRT